MPAAVHASHAILPALDAPSFHDHARTDWIHRHRTTNLDS